MGTEQYHEPPEELSEKTRTFARLCANLTEEAEAIGWYEQRISLEKDEAAKAIMIDSLGEEFKHFSMELEYLMRHKPVWQQTARGILFHDGDIVANGEAAEAAAGSGSGDGSSGSGSSGSGSSGGGSFSRGASAGLGIGSLRGKEL